MLITLSRRTAILLVVVVVVVVVVVQILSLWRGASSRIADGRIGPSDMEVSWEYIE